MRIIVILCCLALGACETYVVDPEAVPVRAVFETEPVASSDDAADDPAIWVHPVNPARSLILGTDKQNGLAVYNLQGEQVQFLPVGNLNNVDLRSNILIAGRRISLAVGTNRSDITLDIFSIDDNGLVELIFQQPLDMEDPYGVCLYRNPQGTAFVFVNSTDGLYQQFQLNSDMNGELSPSLLGSFMLDSQPEGCAVDDPTGILYAGEEAVGIWQMPADISRADERRLIAVTDNIQLTADVEGMDVYRHADGSLYLIASSQGDNTYAVFDLNDNAVYKGSFRLELNPDNGVDPSQETDGLTVSSVAFDARFPRGMLVVQDGFNENPRENQNFKAVSWQDVASALRLD